MGGDQEIELTETERDALHELQLGVEHLYRGYGSLLEFHHTIGRGMDHFDEAETLLREAGHEEAANELLNEQLPAGVLEGTWTFEIVEAFKRGFLADVTAFEEAVRDDLADGQQHITERKQQQEWVDRAER